MSWKKFTAFNSSPTMATYPNLPQHITFLRLFLGLAYGISLGFRENIPNTTLNGGIGLIFGLNIITFIPVIYMNYFLNIDTADGNSTYKGLFFAGVVNGMALMVLVWVLFFTLIHEVDEGVFSDALISGVDSVDSVVSAGGSSANDIGDSSTATGGGIEDSEF